MLFYYDTSALVKLVIPEAETEALRAWRQQRRGRAMASSALVRVELPRAVRRHGPAAVERAAEQIRALNLLAVSDDLLDEAGEVGTDALRALDAIHVVSAQAYGSELEALVTYDHRMIAAANALKLPVAHPGMMV